MITVTTIVRYTPKPYSTVHKLSQIEFPDKAYYGLGFTCRLIPYPFFRVSTFLYT